VSNVLGAGFLEKLYERALIEELLVARGSGGGTSYLPGADFSLQLSDPTFRPALLAIARKGVPRPIPELRRQRCNTLGFTSNARAASVIDTPCSSRRPAANLNSFVSCLRDNPMTQFSIQCNK
jgi:hypothetical protein